MKCRQMADDEAFQIQQAMAASMGQNNAAFAESADLEPACTSREYAQVTLGVGYSLCAGIGRTSSLPLCVSLSTFPPALHGACFPS